MNYGDNRPVRAADGRVIGQVHRSLVGFYRAYSCRSGRSFGPFYDEADAEAWVRAQVRADEDERIEGRVLTAIRASCAEAADIELQGGEPEREVLAGLSDGCDGDPRKSGTLFIGALEGKRFAVRVTE